MLGIDFFPPEKKTPNHTQRLVGEKPPLKLKEVWAIRVRLHMSRHSRDLALLNVAIDSKLRACVISSCRVFRISASPGRSRLARSSCSRRPSDPSNSRSRSRRALLFRPGLSKEV